MAHFYTYETVEIPLEFTPNGVLQDYSHIVVTIRQEGVVEINKTENDLGIDVENNVINLSLSQEETSKFIGGNGKTKRVAEIQVNIYYTNTNRDVSSVEYIDVYDNLYKRVIENES